MHRKRSTQLTLHPQECSICLGLAEFRFNVIEKRVVKTKCTDTNICNFPDRTKQLFSSNPLRKHLIKTLDHSMKFQDLHKIGKGQISTDANSQRVQRTSTKFEEGKYLQLFIPTFPTCNLTRCMTFITVSIL